MCPQTQYKSGCRWRGWPQSKRGQTEDAAEVFPANFGRHGIECRVDRKFCCQARTRRAKGCRHGVREKAARQIRLFPYELEGQGVPQIPTPWRPNQFSSQSKNSQPNATYGEGSIRVLKGLEPVKQRPACTPVPTTPAHHSGVIDNAADEALAGLASALLSLCIPMGPSALKTMVVAFLWSPPRRAGAVVEIVFTRLHAGGKFDKGLWRRLQFLRRFARRGVSVTNACPPPAGHGVPRQTGRPVGFQWGRRD